MEYLEWICMDLFWIAFIFNCIGIEEPFWATLPVSTRTHRNLIGLIGKLIGLPEFDWINWKIYWIIGILLD